MVITPDEIKTFASLAGIDTSLIDNDLKLAITSGYEEATALIARFAPNAPDDIQDNAKARLITYSLNNASNLGDAWRLSGAASLIAPWKELRHVAIS